MYFGHGPIKTAINLSVYNVYNLCTSLSLYTDCFEYIVLSDTGSPLLCNADFLIGPTDFFLASIPSVLARVVYIRPRLWHTDTLEMWGAWRALSIWHLAGVCYVKRTPGVNNAVFGCKWWQHCTTPSRRCWCVWAPRHPPSRLPWRCITPPHQPHILLSQTHRYHQALSMRSKLVSPNTRVSYTNMGVHFHKISNNDPPPLPLLQPTPISTHQMVKSLAGAHKPPSTRPQAYAHQPHLHILIHDVCIEHI